jgi:hypothetical protein
VKLYLFKSNHNQIPYYKLETNNILFKLNTVGNRMLTIVVTIYVIFREPNNTLVIHYLLVLTCTYIIYKHPIGRVVSLMSSLF